MTKKCKTTCHKSKRFATNDDRRLAKDAGITIDAQTPNQAGEIDINKAWQKRQETHESANKIFDESCRLRDKAINMLLDNETMFIAAVRQHLGHEDFVINWETGEVKS
jgi:hypothetical protein